jgi:hypothetical protein
MSLSALAAVHARRELLLVKWHQRIHVWGCRLPFASCLAGLRFASDLQFPRLFSLARAELRLWGGGTGHGRLAAGRPGQFRWSTFGTRLVIFAFPATNLLEGPSRSVGHLRCIFFVFLHVFLRRRLCVLNTVSCIVAISDIRSHVKCSCR